MRYVILPPGRYFDGFRLVRVTQSGFRELVETYQTADAARIALSAITNGVAA